MPIPTSNFVNVALRKRAIQSSRSFWSKADDAAGLINGDYDQDFSFHTENEDAPWWQLDLLQSYPIEMIVVHNRRDLAQDRARTLKIEVSTDLSTWITVHQGLCYFGAVGAGHPLSIPLGGKLWARYIRLSLEENTTLHLSQLEILIDHRAQRFFEIRADNGLEVELINERATVGFHEAYSLESDSGSYDRPLVGLELAENGAFGNCAIQYANAIMLAQKLGLKYIRISQNDRCGLINIIEPIEIQDLTFLPANYQLNGLFLKGFFFDSRSFHKAIGHVTAERFYRINQNYIRYLFNALPPKIAPKPDDELLIHIRSGDIFATWVSGSYVQPPLSFYKRVVEKARASLGCTKAKLVFENKANPVIDALINHLTDIGFPFLIQSGALQDDIFELVNGQHLVFGFGSFGSGICNFSQSIKSVFFFSPGLDPGFKRIPSVQRAFEMIDTAGGYIKSGDWQNTAEQRQLMLDYPAEGLAFV